MKKTVCSVMILMGFFCVTNVFAKGPITGFEDDVIEIVDSTGAYVDIDVKKLGNPTELVLVKVLDSGMWKVKNKQGKTFTIDRGDLVLDPNYVNRKDNSRGKCHDQSGAGVMGVDDCQ